MKKDNDNDIGLTEEELNLWDVVTESDKRWKSIEEPIKPPKNKEIGNEFKVRSELKKVDVPVPKEDKFPYIRTGQIVGVDGSTAEKLRKGKLRPEATLDLHGMTQNDAFEELTNFLSACHSRGKRCVLVITGKGFKKDGSIGILRENVPKWLNSPHIRPVILAFDHAQPKDGGEGALYVLLKKK